MDERRKLPRKYLMAYSSVYNQNDGQLLGYLCDLTLDGLMIISKKPKPLGSEREIRIDLPEAPVFPKRRLIFKSRVIWCRPDVDPRLHNIGFQLLELAAEDEPIIEQMIETYELRRDQGTYPPSIDELNKNI